MTEQRTDQDLIAAANRGDQEAMEALYYRHRDWVLATATGFCSNAADAQDVAQDVFKYFFSKFPGFKLSCELRTFLYPAVRNRSLDLLRKRRRQGPLDGTDRLSPDALPGRQSLDEASVRARVSECVASLPEELRDVLLLRFADGFSLAEIADRLGIPVGTVKSRLHNALKRLRSESW